MLFEANGLPVVAGSLTLPRTGVWTADLTVDSEDAMSGDVVLKLASLELHGVVVRSGAHRGTSFARVVGGKGGYAKLFGPKSYDATPLHVVLEDVASAAGESLSQTSDQGILNAQLPRWVAVQQQCSSAVQSLLDAAAPDDAAWRVLMDGSTWVGQESWRASPMVYDLLEESPERGIVKISSDDPSILPGQTLDDGRKADSVVHRVDARRLRTSIWLTT